MTCDDSFMLIFGKEKMGNLGIEWLLCRRMKMATSIGSHTAPLYSWEILTGSAKVPDLTESIVADIDSPRYRIFVPRFSPISMVYPSPP